MEGETHVGNFMDLQKMPEASRGCKTVSDSQDSPERDDEAMQ